MKKLLIALFMMFAGVAFADTGTVTWYNEDLSSYETTTCTIGGDIILPTPPTKTGYTFLGWESALPDGYTQLEYIQGDRSAYLKSGIILDNNSGVEAKFQFPNTEGANTGNFICGARNSGPQNAFTFVGFSGGSYWASNYNNSLETFGSADTNIHTMKRDKEKVYFDGSLVLTSTSATFTTPGEAYVFSTNQGEAPFLTSNIKLWYLKMWDNGTLVRNFVPAKRNSDNEVGMYDVVSDVFFTNQGTGTFIAGPVVQ